MTAKMRITRVSPTRLHVGHYLSVIKPSLTIPYVRVLIAEYDAPQAERKAANKMILTMERMKVPMNQIVFQSEEFDSDLYFRLLSIARISELERIYQTQPSNDDIHSLTYPILMTHDVFGYDEIITGEETPYVNYARDLIQRYSSVFKEDVVVPEVVTVEAGQIMSLVDPSKKMSQVTPEGCLFLDDTPDTFRKKIKKAVTNEEGRKNLINLYQAFGGTQAIPEINEPLKELVAETLINKICAKAHSQSV